MHHHRHHQLYLKIMNMQDIINWSMAFSLLDAEEGACEIKIDYVLEVSINKNMTLK